MKHTQNAFSSVTFKEDKYAWLGVILCAVVIILVVNVWWQPVPAELHASDSRSPDPLVTVLYYERVSVETQDNVVDQAQLEAQFLALREEGFVAISLEDLLGFYYSNRHLPKKSLFLIFGNGYLETYVAVDPVLRKLKWPAMMSVITGAVTEKDPKYLYWDRLSRMVESGFWSVGSSGYQTRGFIPIGPNGEQGRFLYHRRWIEEQRRAERDEEFQNRVHQDFRRNAEMFRQNFAAYQVPAFSPLFQHSHQMTPASPFRQEVKEFFQVSFVDSIVGVNDRNSDPFSLRRLRVHSEWSPEDLLTRVRQALQLPTIQGNSVEAQAVTWFESDGDIVQSGDSVEGDRGVQSPKIRDDGQVSWLNLPTNGEQEIWIPGGHWGGSWILEFQFILEHGEIGVRQKHAEGRGEWRWGGKADAVFFQRKNDQGLYENLTISSSGITRGIPYNLKIIKRGKGVSAWLNGVSLWDTPTFLHDEFTGDIGVFVWSVDGAPSLKVTHATMTLLPFEFYWLPGFPAQNEVRAVVERAREISGVSITTHVLTNKGLIPRDYNEMFYKMLAARYAFEIIPTIEVALENGGATQANASLLLAFKEWLRTNSWSKVQLNVKGMPSNTSQRDLASLLLLDDSEAFHQQLQLMITSRKGLPQGTLRFHPITILNIDTDVTHG